MLISRNAGLTLAAMASCQCSTDSGSAVDKAPSSTMFAVRGSHSFSAMAMAS